MSEGLKIKTSDPDRKLSANSRWWRVIALVSFYRSFCIDDKIKDITIDTGIHDIRDYIISAILSLMICRYWNSRPIYDNTYLKEHINSSLGTLA